MLNLNLIIVSVALVLLIADQTSSQEPQCSDIFKKELDFEYLRQYTGSITLRSEQTLHDPEIEIIFDRNVVLLVNYFGFSSSDNNREFTITKRGYILRAGIELKVKIEVNYEGRVKPSIQEIKLNGNRICRTSSAPVRGPSLNFEGNTSRNFTDNTRNKFNSSCNALNPNIVVSPGRWDAVLNLVSDTTTYGITIEIIFNKPIYILGNHFGAASTTDNTRFSITNSSLILLAEASLELEFFVKYNELDREPDVREVLFNGKEMCKKDQRNRRVTMMTETPIFVTRPTFTEDPQTEASTTRSTTISNIYNRNEEDFECASVPELQFSTRIIGGAGANLGDFPWHAGIFNDDQYSCGGTLISKRTVLTAAHCVTKTNTNKTLELDEIQVYLGIIDLRNVDDHFYFSVSEIKVHKDFNPLYYTTDIALLILSRDTVINNYIKPVCLYNRTTDISTLHSQSGKVAGWGVNQDGIVNNVLNYLDMPVVSQKTCIQSNTYFSTILAYGESFCAGETNGNSVCNGDSGGGLVFVENGQYFIRGIVSVSAQRRNQLMCDPYRYSVFTDVSKFLTWIRNNMR